MAINSKGETLIAWAQSNRSGTQIFRSHYRNGAWIDPTDITDHLGPNSDIHADPWSQLAITATRSFAGACLTGRFEGFYAVISTMAFGRTPLLVPMVKKRPCPKSR